MNKYLLTTGFLACVALLNASVVMPEFSSGMSGGSLATATWSYNANPAHPWDGFSTGHAGEFTTADNSVVYYGFSPARISSFIPAGEMIDTSKQAWLGLMTNIIISESPLTVRLFSGDPAGTVAFGPAVGSTTVPGTGVPDRTSSGAGTNRDGVFIHLDSSAITALANGTYSGLAVSGGNLSLWGVGFQTNRLVTKDHYNQAVDWEGSYVFTTAAPNTFPYSGAGSGADPNIRAGFLEFATVAIPEPGFYAAAVGALCLLIVAKRRK